MRIAAALILATIAGAALRPDHPQPRVVHRGRRRGPRQRRAGICGILRRRHHARREPGGRHQAAYRARRPRPTAASARTWRSTMSASSARRFAWSKVACRRDLRTKAGTAFEYRAITTFALKANQLASLNDVISSIAAAGVFEVRTIRYGIKDEERAIDERAAQRSRMPAGRPRSMPMPPASSLPRFWKSSTAWRRISGSEASLRAATPNVQVSPPATIPFRAGINIKWRIVSKP